MSNLERAVDSSTTRGQLKRALWMRFGRGPLNCHGARLANQSLFLFAKFEKRHKNLVEEI